MSQTHRVSSGAQERPDYEDWGPTDTAHQRASAEYHRHFASGALPAPSRSPAGRPPSSPNTQTPYPDSASDIMDRPKYYPRGREQDEEEYNRKRRVPSTTATGMRRGPSPPPDGRTPRRPPALLRRQSSLDTFDRLPSGFVTSERYGPPARLDHSRYAYSPDPYSTAQYSHAPYSPAQPAPPSPAPRSPRPDDDYGSRRDSFSDTRRPAYGGLAHRSRPPPDFGRPDTGHFNYDGYHPDQVFHEHERESDHLHPHRHRGRDRGRSRSRDSKTTTTAKTWNTGHTSRSSSSSSASSDSSGSHHTTKSEYPKKGKTRIPSALVHVKALAHCGYKYEKDGDFIVVLLALGQDDISKLLKESKKFIKGEEEKTKSDEKTATVAPAAPKPQPRPQSRPPPRAASQKRSAAVVVGARQTRDIRTRPEIVDVVPPSGPPVEQWDGELYYHEHSHAHNHNHGHHSHHSWHGDDGEYPYVSSNPNPVDRLLESDHVHIGPLVLAEDHERRRSRYRSKSHGRSKSRRRSRTRSRSRGGAARGTTLAEQIREMELEREARRTGRRYRSTSAGRNGTVRYHERLSNGELIVYEEKTRHFDDHDDEMWHSDSSRSRSRRRRERRHSYGSYRSKSRGPRIERDRKGPPPLLVKAMLATLT